MKVTFLWVGKTKDGDISSLIAKYLNALKRFVEIDIMTIRPAGIKNPEAARKKEGEDILKRLGKRGLRIGLDASGRAYTSEAFASAFERWMETGGARCTFVLGGEEGLWKGVFDKLDETLSLSKMTLTHEMARLVLTEQVYRALTILKGTGYHR